MFYETKSSTRTNDSKETTKSSNHVTVKKYFI